MSAINLSELKWRDIIRFDFSDNIPSENPIIEARRKRLDELAQEEERKYKKSLEPEEHSASKTFSYIHYIYGAYELVKCLLN